MNKDIEGLAVVVLSILALVFALYAAAFAIPLVAIGFGGYMIHRWRFNAPKAQERQAREHTQELYEKAKALVANIPDKEEFARQVIDRLSPAPRAVEHAIIVAVLDLYDAEYTFAQIPEPPVVCNTIDGARYRDFLSSYGAKITNVAAPKIAIDAIVEGFEDFIRYVPKVSGEESAPFSTPLSAVMPRANMAIHELLLAFFSEDIINLNLFKKLREQANRNLEDVSPERDVLPKDYEGDDAPFVFLKGTPFLDIMNTHIPIALDTKVRFEHHWIVSAPGGGKTQTFQALIKADLDLVAKNEASVVVIDSQRDLIKNIAHLKAFAKGGELEGKLILLEPNIEHPLALNPFAFRAGPDVSEQAKEELNASAIDLLTYVFSGLLGTEMTTKQETLFRFVLRACLAIPNATIQTFSDLLKDHRPFMSHINRLPAPARDFFETQYDTAQFPKTREEVGWRLSLLRESTIFDRMFSSAERKFDFYTELASSKVILINTDKMRLKDRSSTLGRLFIALLLHASEKRAAVSRGDRLPVFCYIDEFGDYANDSRVVNILDQARKMNIGMIFANQRISQVTAPGLLDALQNCSIKFARAVNDSDASALARNMGTKPDFIRSQTARHFAAFIRGTTPKAISLAIPFFVMENEEKMSPEEQNALLAEMRERFSTSHSGEAEPVIRMAAEEEPPSEW